MINSFMHEYRFLSNFYTAPIVVKDITYPSLENVFQAAKTTDEALRVPFQFCTATIAKRRGRKLRLREDWDDIKLDVMLFLVRRKFKKEGELATLLLDTYPQELVEGNWWNDTFWGVCDGVGENHLGKILMKVREELQA